MVPLQLIQITKKAKMIWDSYYYKANLLKICSHIEKSLLQKRWTDSSYVRLENNIMIGCYLVRKLIESNKISDDVENLEIPIYSCPIKEDEVIDVMTDHLFNEKYNLSTWTMEHIKPKSFCDKIIHSLIFAAHLNLENKLNGLFFNSDYTKNKLFIISTQNIIQIFKNVANDNIVEISYHRKVRSGNLIGKYSLKKRNPECEILEFQNNNPFVD